MKIKNVDIKNLSDRAALELICSELNALRAELIRELGRFDAGNIIFDDGGTLPDYIKKISENAVSSAEV